MLRLITDNILPLYTSIMQETDLGEDFQKFKEAIDSDCICVIT